MRPADLIRHSSFRLAMLMTLLIVATLLLAGGVGYGLMHAQLTGRQDARVMEMFQSLQQAMTAGDEKDLVEAVTSRIAASPDHASVYRLTDSTGRVLAANLQGLDPKPGWSSVPVDLAGVSNAYPYRVFTGQAGGYKITVGLTDADLDDLREIMAGAMGWAALTALIAALAVGAALAARMDRRLTLVDRTLGRISEGDLAARLPLSGRGDDLDHIATSINAALTRLERVVEAMRQVSADIAHDLRTPLNRLRIRIEQAAARAEGSLVADDLAAALSETDQINDTFSALLRIAQIESGSRKAGFVTLDLAQTLRDVAEVYREVAEDAGQALALQPLAPAQISGDADLLTQMFANLVENAIRHCPPGTTISCGLVPAAGRVRVTIADTGPGIPDSEREKVQRRLYRLEKSRTTPGSGLGLSLVRAICDLHGAALTLRETDAATDSGLTVQIDFPAVPPSSSLTNM